MVNDKIFVDTSVIIAALLSPTGGSSYLFETYRDTRDFLINEHVLKEVLRIITGKLSNNLATEDFFRLAKTIRLQVKLNPSADVLQSLDGVIEKDDQPILASALEHADYLLTLDNHFFGEAVCRYVSTRGLQILKPKDFIELYR